MKSVWFDESPSVGTRSPIASGTTIAIAVSPTTAFSMVSTSSSPASAHFAAVKAPGGVEVTEVETSSPVWGL